MMLMGAHNIPEIPRSGLHSWARRWDTDTTQRMVSGQASSPNSCLMAGSDRFYGTQLLSTQDLTLDSQGYTFVRDFLYVQMTTYFFLYRNSCMVGIGTVRKGYISYREKVYSLTKCRPNFYNITTNIFISLLITMISYM